jgi:hypothetical protein
MRIANRPLILSLLAVFLFTLFFIPRLDTNVLAQTDEATEEATEDVTAEATEVATDEAEALTEEAAETTEATDEGAAEANAEATEAVTEEATEEADPVLVITEESATEEPGAGTDGGATGEGEVEAVDSSETAEGSEQAALGRLMLVLGVLAIGLTGVVMIMRERNEAQKAP